MLISPTVLFSKEHFMVTIGGHMAPCHKCGQLQPHLIHQVRQRNSGIVTIYKDAPLYKISQCEVCHESFRHQKNNEPPVIEIWNAGSDLHDYAIRSGHDHIDPNYRLITPMSAQALLESVTSKSATAMKLNWKDYFIACSMFILCGLVAVIMFNQHANDDDAIIILLGIPSTGLFSALFFLVYLQNRRKVKIDHLSDFHARLNRLGLTPHSVVSVMPQAILINPKIYTLVRPFM